ncbi:hypothetical protein J1N35_028993 [Gossypium stocksii]|uniref:Uncharacterized protein n=1 Tax=Gossypium stocksii TaxID=47602 RepID=A0A9D3UWZ5_9ROSI|nr:hypothetical protein J1N35_028993 [Gossypium stocksii]
METPTNSINSHYEALVQSSIQNSVLFVAATVSHNERPVKFSGENFKTWQQKILFYLTMLNLVKFLKDDPPTVKEGKVDEVTAFTVVEAWNYSSFLCRNYILNGLSNALYEELQLIVHKLAEGMIVSESFQVAAIIEKLPPIWNDFKSYLKHKRKEMSVEELIVRLRIEEDNRGTKKRLNKVANNNIARANVVEVKKDFKKEKQS